MTDFFEPRISADTKAYWEGCRAHELRFQRCKCCGRLRAPAAYLCPECLSEENELVTLPNEGTLYSYIVMRKPFHPSLAEKVPYVVAAVDLTEDIRILANMEMSELEGLRCGDKLEIGWYDSETYSRPIARRRKA